MTTNDLLSGAWNQLHALLSERYHFGKVDLRNVYIEKLNEAIKTNPALLPAMDIFFEAFTEATRHD